MTSAALVLIWVGLVVGVLFERRRAPPPRPRPAELVRAVSFTPARDEREVIDAALDGLLAQSVLQVVVVDDGSTDGTRERMASRQSELRVLDAPAPAPGVFGKPAALAYAVSETQVDAAEWCAFVDADVVLMPGALSALVHEAERHGWDLVSAHPRQEYVTLVERVVLPAVQSLVVAAYPPQRVNAGRRPFANGQLLLVRRAAYAAVGGHASVRDQVLEDVALARRVAASGFRVGLVDGRRLARTRMYASWAELSEGWQKNLASLLGPGPARALGLATLSLGLASAGPLAFLADGAPGLLAWALILGMQAFLRKLMDIPVKEVVLAPIGALVALGLVVGSLRRHRGGPDITWKGRDYPGGT